MSASNYFCFDLTEIKEENLDIGASIKVKSLCNPMDIEQKLTQNFSNMNTYTSIDNGANIKPESRVNDLKMLDCVNDDILDYEEREAQMAKLKTETGDYPDTDSHVQTREKSGSDQEDKTMNFDTSKPWKPVGVSKVVDHFDAYMNNGDQNIRDKTFTDDIDDTEGNTTTDCDSDNTCLSERKGGIESKPKGRPSNVFKDPNKVLDPNSYVYKRSNGRDANLDQRNPNASATVSCVPSNSVIRQRMEKKYLSFVNKTTQHRLESYLIYFNDFRLEAILVSHMNSDKTELYTRTSDPNTFYRLFYNFVKAEETTPKPTIRAIEVSVIANEIATINGRITNCTEKENEEVPFKKPRLTANNQVKDFTRNPGSDIVRSARKLMKMRRESAMGDYSKPSESYTGTRRSSLGSRYWEFRGKKYVCKDEC